MIQINDFDLPIQVAEKIYGQKPFPTYKPQKPTGDFKRLLDEEMEKLNERDDMGRSDDKIRNGQDVQEICSEGLS